MQEIGLFCGTFNPIHFGHLLLAERAREQFALSPLIFVTSANPPHRPEGVLDAGLRYRLVQAACSGNPYFQVSSIELERQGPSYTVDTVSAFKAEFGNDCRINLLIGQDNLGSIHTWHRAKDLLAACRLLVAPRGQGEEISSLVSYMKEFADIEAIALSPVHISSSEIRARLLEGRSIRYMVPNAVRDILLAEAQAAYEAG